MQCDEENKEVFNSDPTTEKSSHMYGTKWIKRFGFRNMKGTDLLWGGTDSNNYQSQ